MLNSFQPLKANADLYFINFILAPTIVHTPMHTNPSAMTPYTSFYGSTQQRMITTPHARLTKRATPTSITCSTAPSPSTQELTLLTPDPKRFTVAQGQLNNVATAAAGSVLRLGSGVFAHGYKSQLAKDTSAQDGSYSVLKFAGQMVKESSAVATLPRPTQPLIIHEPTTTTTTIAADGKKVREALTILDLDCIFYPPSPSSSSSSLRLIDPNTNDNVEIQSSGDNVVEYLFKTYGGTDGGAIPFMLRRGWLNNLTAAWSVGLRSKSKSSSNTSSNSRRSEVKHPLVYWGYEGSPFCVIAHEAIEDLRLPFLFRPTARGAPKRQELYDRYRHFQVPYVEDPNTGVALFESKDIVEYLYKTYGI